MADMDFEAIDQVVSMAHDDWKAGKQVLIRCQAGLNRSGLIMALVLRKEGYTSQEAIDLIRARRSEWALFNKTFEKWLLALDTPKE
jgi:protein-tyrosine phosphatase